MSDNLLITGSSGLVGSACTEHFARQGRFVHGLDNNQRREWFGNDGDTFAVGERLGDELDNFCHWAVDIRDRQAISDLVAYVKPSLVIHCAGQPSHDFAASHPFEDFEVNALGTLNLLEAVRQHAPEAVFVFMSTNKVYGDLPNRLLPVLEVWECHGEKGLEEAPARFEMNDKQWNGFDETLPIDQCTHSLFGCSKLAADVMVQEYGRYFGLKTVCFRCGCLTGSAHAAAEQHGFLAYLARCLKEGRKYRVYGYKGKQVRDNLHAFDVARACEEFAKNPKCGAVYNLGGGRANSCSVLEAIALMERASGKKLDWEYVDEARKGDHVCYISDCSKFKRDYPEWSVTRSLDDIISELVA
jgi:CDP-paratose 2-epimerase